MLIQNVPTFHLSKKKKKKMLIQNQYTQQPHIDSSLMNPSTMY